MLLIWSLYAKAYDITNKNIPYLKLLRDVTDELDLRIRQKILDAGCGTGSLSVKILEKYPESHIVCIDVSPAMLDKAKEKLKDSKSVEFHLQDLDGNLSLPENYFDRIVMVNSLYLLKYPEKIIKDFYKSLKANGKLVIANPHDQAKLSKIFSAQKKELGIFKFIIGFLFNLPYLLIILFVNIFYLTKNKNFFRESELQNLLSKADFKNIKFKKTYAEQNFLVSARK